MIFMVNMTSKIFENNFFLLYKKWPMRTQVFELGLGNLLAELDALFESKLKDFSTENVRFQKQFQTGLNLKYGGGI